MKLLDWREEVVSRVEARLVLHRERRVLLLHLLQAPLNKGLLVLGELLVLRWDGHANLHPVLFAAVAVGPEAVVQVLARLANPVTLALGQIHLYHAPALGARFGGIPMTLVPAVARAGAFPASLARRSLRGVVRAEVIRLALLVVARPHFLAPVAGLSTREVIVLAIAADPAILGQVCNVQSWLRW